MNYSDLEYEIFSKQYDLDLAYKVMRWIHFTYYETIGLPIPKKSRLKLGRSKRLRKHLKYKKSNGTFS